MRGGKSVKEVRVAFSGNGVVREAFIDLIMYTVSAKFWVRLYDWRTNRLYLEPQSIRLSSKTLMMSAKHLCISDRL